MKKDDTKDSIKPMSLLSLILSFVALFVISALLFIPMGEDARQVLINLDLIICCVFLIQLLVDLSRSSNRMAFIKAHWMDFLASIPVVEALRFARIFHILRVVRLLRTSHSVLDQLKANRKETTVASILLLMVILISVGSSTILLAEAHHPDANIKSGGDALWWAFVTISTVGYGDHYPVTYIGKFIAIIIILCGVGMFGMISGLVTSIIAAPKNDSGNLPPVNDALLLRVLEQQQQIIERLDSVESELQRQKK